MSLIYRHLPRLRTFRASLFLSTLLIPAALASSTTAVSLLARSGPLAACTAPPASAAAFTFTSTRPISSTCAAMASATGFYSYKPLDKKGQPYDLSQLEGKVVLVVNTASKCGFTPQLEGLEKIYKELKATHGDKFEILGFPCNQFGGQEPGDNVSIQSFCQLNYGVSFPVLGKTNVNGDDAEPLYDWLKTEKPGVMGIKRIKWNFEKFLVGKDGKVKERWASTSKPESLKGAIEKELAN